MSEDELAISPRSRDRRLAARITELSEQVEAKDARIAELRVAFAELCERRRLSNDRALAAESTLAKSQAEVERLRGEAGDARAMLMAAVYSSGQEIEVVRRAFEVLPGLTITRHESPIHGSIILRTHRTALQETSDDQ